MWGRVEAGRGGAATAGREAAEDEIVCGRGGGGREERESRRMRAAVSVLSKVSVLLDARVDEISSVAMPISRSSSTTSSDELDESDDGDAARYASSSTDAVEIDRSYIYTSLVRLG